MQAIAIILGDNDFGSTFKPLLETINRVLDYRDLDKDKVTELIFDGIEFHYRAFQQDEETVQDANNTVAYLLTNTRVIFDEEAYAASVTEDHDCGSWLLHVQDHTIEPF